MTAVGFVYLFILLVGGGVQMLSVLRYPWRPEGATECSGAEVSDGCKPPDSWNCSFLFTSSKRSKLLSDLYGLWVCVSSHSSDHPITHYIAQAGAKLVITLLLKDHKYESLGPARSKT